MAYKWLGIDSEEGRKKWDDRLALTVGVLGAAIILGALVAAVVMSVQIYTHDKLPGTGNPLEPIFASRLMIAAARLTVLFVGVYIVLSVLMHMRRGQWITAAGPLKVSEAARRLSTGTIRGREQVRVLLKQNDRLKTRISELTTELRSYERRLQQAERSRSGGGSQSG